MTKKLLEQYPDICAELRDLDRVVTDTVSGSSPEPPYVQHAVSIQGVAFTKRRARLERQKAEIEAFVDRLPDECEKVICQLVIPYNGQALRDTGILRYNKEGRWFCDNNMIVTHWMPLPDPPENIL